MRRAPGERALGQVKRPKSPGAPDPPSRPRQADRPHSGVRAAELSGASHSLLRASREDC